MTREHQFFRRSEKMTREHQFFIKGEKISGAERSRASIFYQGRKNDAGRSGAEHQFFLDDFRVLRRRRLFCLCFLD
jgi:hypothetical protein